MKDTPYQILQLALHLPTHEEALAVFTTIGDLNVRSSAGKVNIIHHYITSCGYGSQLRIKDLSVLIQMGVDVNAHAEDGQTPLHFCVNHANLEVFKVLIEHNAEIDSTDSWGNTPLHSAISRYRGQENLLKIILLLLEKGADLDKYNEYGHTPREAAKRIKFMVDNLSVAKKEWDLSPYIKLD